MLERGERLRGSQRGPALVNAGIAALLLAAIVPLALHAAQSPPPAVAEFAPQVQQQVKQAPPGLAAQVGAAPAPPSPSPPGVSAQAGPQVPSNQVLQCVGDPPRQTEDPQSPPCIAYWQGDNGGATWRGVTADTVYVVVPTDENHVRDYEALRKFFNTRYELYHRQLVFEYCASGLGESPQASQDADAANAATGCGGSHDGGADQYNAPAGHPPFGSAIYRSVNGYYYNRDMACKYGVVAVGSYQPYTDSYMRQCSPYFWQYLMDVEDEFANVGQWICARLAGRTARFASGTDGSVPPQQLASKVRKFGLIVQPYYPDDPAGTPAVYDNVLNQLKGCGVAIPPRDVLINPIASSAPGVTVDPATAENAMLQLKQDGVTSVIGLVNLFGLGALQKAADNEAYYPEWLESTYGPDDINTAYQLGSNPPDQLQHTLGVSFEPRQIPPQLEPYYMAIKSVDPGDSIDSTGDTTQNRQEDYRPLLLLVSGIQMAGPQLTPGNFAAGLWHAVFPNPDTVTHAGHVGFGGQSLSMTLDANEWWYGLNQTGPYSDTQQGTICYVADGIRHPSGQWPPGDDSVFFGLNACHGQI